MRFNKILNIRNCQWRYGLGSISLSAILLLSCSSGFTPGQYLDYFNKHQALYSKTINRAGYSVSVTYCPPELIVARIKENDASLKSADLVAKFSNSLLFKIKITTSDSTKSFDFVTGGNGREGYSDAVVKNTFKREGDIFLLNGRDTVSVADYQYERNWGLGEGDAFTISFSRKALKKNIRQYHLYLRDMLSEIGTIDLSLRDLIPSRRISLKG